MQIKGGAIFGDLAQHIFDKVDKMITARLSAHEERVRAIAREEIEQAVLEGVRRSMAASNNVPGVE